MEFLWLTKRYQVQVQMPLVQWIRLEGSRLARGMTTTNYIGLTKQRELMVFWVLLTLI